MAIRPVVFLPHPALTRPTKPIERFDEVAMALAADLVETMRSRPACVGLAANQIAEPVSMFCVDVTGHRKAVSCAGELVICNPELVWMEESVTAREGCLSVPDFTGDVVRPARVVVRGFTPAGRPQTVMADAFEARALMHEMDHLCGRLFLDRVESPAAVFRRKVYR
ncbi:MAG: peptide deformylase [Acidimicrobiales bacterium]